MKTNAKNPSPSKSSKPSAVPQPQTTARPSHAELIRKGRARVDKEREMEKSILNDFFSTPKRQGGCPRVVHGVLAGALYKLDRRAKLNVAEELNRWANTYLRVAGLVPKFSESRGSLTMRNYWVKVGISKEEAAIIKRVSKQYGFKKAPTASMARQLITMALLDLPSVERTWNAACAYCEAEGIEGERDIDAYLQRRAELALGSLESRQTV